MAKESEKASKQEVAKKNPLNVLFPEEEVALPDGSVITVRPLSLEALPKVADSFGKLMRYVESGMGPAEIASVGFGEIVALLPFCIDHPIEEIPAAYGPEIIGIVIDQNVSDEVVAKWQALVDRLVAFTEADQGKKSKATKK